METDLPLINSYIPAVKQESGMTYRKGEKILVEFSGEVPSFLQKNERLMYLDYKSSGKNRSHAFFMPKRIGSHDTYLVIFSDEKHILQKNGTLILDGQHTGQRIVGMQSPDFGRLKTIDELLNRR